MLKIRNGRLSPAVGHTLAEYQGDVKAQPTYPRQVQRAKMLFGRHNRWTNPAFAAVRRKLEDMCCGERRCMYCEDSVADEVEHFRPNFIVLHLRSTFEFTPFAEVGTVEFRRADYTIDILRINERDYLREARRNAMVSYEARLASYVELRNGGASARKVARVKRCIQHSPHPTVWAEMKRQHGHHHSFATLFHAAPEALDF